MALDIGQALKEASHVGGLPLMYQRVSGTGVSSIHFNPIVRKAMWVGGAVWGLGGVVNAALTYQDPRTRVTDMSEPSTTMGRGGSNYAMALHYNNR